MAVEQPTTRRAVMLGSAGTFALAAPVGAMNLGDNPDARLTELAREFSEKDPEQDRLSQLGELQPHYSAERAAFNARSDALGDRLLDITTEAVGLRASTSEGLRAKATILRGCLPFVRSGLSDPNVWHTVADNVAVDQHALAWSIVRDMAEMAS